MQIHLVPKQQGQRARWQARLPFPAAHPRGHPPRPFTRTAISAAERRLHWGPRDPALISPLEPERPTDDQGRHLGDLRGRAGGRSSLRAGLHCLGAEGPGPLQGPHGQVPTGMLSDCASICPPMGHARGHGGNTHPPDPPRHPQASCLLQTTPWRPRALEESRWSS